MTDYAIEGSAYERLQRENERLKAERELAVRVAMTYLDRYDGFTAWAYSDDEANGAITWGDVKRIQAWYREAQNTEKGGE